MDEQEAYSKSTTHKSSCHRHPPPALHTRHSLRTLLADLFLISDGKHARRRRSTVSLPSTLIAALLRSSTLNVHGLHPLSTFHPVAKSRGSSLTGTSSPVTDSHVRYSIPSAHYPPIHSFTELKDNHKPEQRSNQAKRTRQPASTRVLGGRPRRGQRALERFG